MRRYALLAAAAFVLSGCQGLRDNLSTPDPNPGACPTAVALYDAHRIVEFEGEEVTFNNVGFTGEITDVGALCRYSDQNADPIDMSMQVNFAFGRGPAARGEEKTYEYFVAVTRQDSVVIAKQTFPITVRFEGGAQRVELTEEIDDLQIPRATPTTSGGNFEVVVGFVLTEDQIEYNRTGQRFRVDAGQ